METTPTVQPRECLSCNKLLKGRIDKKFCDDYCRNVYNNKLRAGNACNQLLRNINSILLKNRRILESLFTENPEKTRVNKEKLLGLGFQFRYLTHSYTNKSGKVYFYCYDYGYMPLDHDWYLVVKNKHD
jgi:hypothetical protein